MNTQLTNWMMQYFDETEDMIIVMDRFNKIIRMNRAAEEILKTEGNLEQISHSLCSFCKGYTSEKELMTCINCFMNHRGQQETFQLFMKNKDGQVLPYSASFLELSGDEPIKILTLQNISPQLKTQESLHQKNITQKIINAQENERKRISRELHDSVVQELLNVMVEFRLMKYKNEEELKKHVLLMEGTISRLMDSIRNLSLELRPSSLDDLGLRAALRSHFKQVEKNHGMAVLFSSNIANDRFDNDIETAAYRVIQEAIFNAIKYADVDEVTVTVTHEGDKLTAEVIDKGDGFNKANAPIGTGLGLFGMQERAEIVGGNVTIESEINKGTTVHLEIPVRRS